MDVYPPRFHEAAQKTARAAKLTFPLDRPVKSSGTPSPSISKLWMLTAWFFDYNKITK